MTLSEGFYDSTARAKRRQQCFPQSLAALCDPSIWHFVEHLWLYQRTRRPGRPRPGMASKARQSFDSQYFLGLGVISPASTASNSNFGSSASGANVAFVVFIQFLSSRSGKSGL